METINQLYDSLVQATKFSQKKQKTLFYWAGRQNVLILIDIMKEQKNQFFKLKNDGIQGEIIPLAALLIAINQYYELSSQNSKKNASNNLASLKKVSEVSIKKTHKPRRKIKYEKLLNLYSKIVDLQSDGLSLVKIKTILQNQHNIEVSHTYIAKMLKDLEDGN